MKKLLMLMAVMLFATALTANPITPRNLARLWFDSGDLFLQFAEDHGYYGYLDRIPELTFVTSAGTWQFPDSFVPPTSLPFTVNISEAIPGFSINPLNDQLVLQDSISWDSQWQESVSWGLGDAVDLRSLQPGQSAVQVMVGTYEGEVAAWAKDIGTEGGFNPVHCYTLSVHTQNQQGIPVSGVPVYLSFTGYISTYYTPYTTDADGNWQLASSAVPTRVRVLDPLTQEIVLDTRFYPEPEETVSLTAVISSAAADDPVQPSASHVLSISPSVLNSASGNTVSLKYGQGISLSESAELKLYDLRGRVLASTGMPSVAEIQWRLPELPSGIYFIALEQGSRQLGRGRISVVK